MNGKHLNRSVTKAAGRDLAQWYDAEASKKGKGAPSQAKGRGKGGGKGGGAKGGAQGGAKGKAKAGTKGGTKGGAKGGKKKRKRGGSSGDSEEEEEEEEEEAEASSSDDPVDSDCDEKEMEAEAAAADEADEAAEVKEEGKRKYGDNAGCSRPPRLQERVKLEITLIEEGGVEVEEEDRVVRTYVSITEAATTMKLNKGKVRTKEGENARRESRGR